MPKAAASRGRASGPRLVVDGLVSKLTSDSAQTAAKGGPAEHLALSSCSPCPPPPLSLLSQSLSLQLFALNPLRTCCVSCAQKEVPFNASVEKARESELKRRKKIKRERSYRDGILFQVLGSSSGTHWFSFSGELIREREREREREAQNVDRSELLKSVSGGSWLCQSEYGGLDLDGLT